MPFNPGDPLFAEQVNSISNHVHDGQTNLVGHADLIHDIELANEPNQIKQNFYNWFNRITFTKAPTGFVINYTAGKVLIGNSLVTVAAGSLVVNPTATTAIFINDIGGVAKASTFPIQSVPLCLVGADSVNITSVTDVRQVSAERLIPVPEVPIIPIGMVQMFLGTTAPTGWLFLNGQVVLKADFTNLFNHLNATLGIGLTQTATTFTLPNYTNRSPIGGSLGTIGGSSTVSLNNTNLPTHRHLTQLVPHTHGVSDGGHNHEVSQAPHNHAISDPGHSHFTSMRHGTIGAQGTWQPTQYHNRPDNPPGTNIITNTNSVATGITSSPAIAQIYVAGNVSNINIVSHTPNAVFTDFFGGGQAVDIRNPFFGINIIIKT